jgi:uncharacterized membrane protein YecN with MAPEG domain
MNRYNVFKICRNTKPPNFPSKSLHRCYLLFTKLIISFGVVRQAAVLVILFQRAGDDKLSVVLTTRAKTLRYVPSASLLSKTRQNDQAEELIDDILVRLLYLEEKLIRKIHIRCILLYVILLLVICDGRSNSRSGEKRSKKSTYHWTIRIYIT